MRKPIMLLAAVLAIAVLTGGWFAFADTQALPCVTSDMCQPGWWAEKAAEPDALLADTEAVEALNAAFVAEPDCCMNDLTAFIPAYDGDVFQRERVKQAMSALSEYMGDGFFRADGAPVRYSDVADILASIDDAKTESNQHARYGICVRQADIRAVPADLLITDDAADIDYDVLQYSSVRVNEPVIVRAQTADGSWYYCDSACVSGWIAAENIAICANRREWLSAWQIPEEERLVVTQGKLYLDEANVNREASERMLTMGTTLRRVSEDDFDPTVTNRALFHNHAVWLPVRDDAGRYGTTIALIPEHASVSEGALPLTAENILNVAFSMLGDAYGWGGMLGVPDCSQYVRNIYQCFGFELPRNTTWQSAMPAMKINLADMSAEEKAEALDALPVGTILFFRGHEMLYLGAHQGRHYVLSSVGSIMNPNGEGVLRIRSVVINTLEDTVRGNGNTWLEDLNQATVPWLPEEATEEEADQTAMTFEEYLAQGGESWFLTGKQAYTIQAMMVSKETSFHNELEVADYTVTDDGETVVLKGLIGEMWSSKLPKVISTYTKPDGSEISAEDFAEKDIYIDIIPRPAPDAYYAMFVPVDISVTLETAWGDVLHTNLPNAPHGDGDYLVCRAGEDGNPDYSDVWVLNGVVFPEYYDNDREGDALQPAA